MTASSPLTSLRSSENATFSSCLAEILRVDIEEIPAATTGIGLEHIGYWLAARNLALIPVRNPAEFQWAGWWIARLSGGDGYVVMAGTPSDVAWSPPDTKRGSSTVLEGWVLAAPALALPKRDAQLGIVDIIYRFADSSAPAEELKTAQLLAGIGIEGDRYALGKGHFSKDGRWGQALTLVEAEAIETLASEHGIEISAADTRRNIVTRNLDLNALIGRQFRIGTVLCKGSRLAEPCAWLQKTTPQGTLRGLVHRGGLRADILETGTIEQGDTIVPVSNS